MCINPAAAPVTVGKFAELTDRAIAARVNGGMHFPVFGRVAKMVGQQIAQYCYRLFPPSNG